MSEGSHEDREIATLILKVRLKKFTKREIGTSSGQER